MTEISARAVAADPDWLPHSYDASGALLVSVHVPRAERAALTFLSDTYYEGRFAKATHPFVEIGSAPGRPAPAPLHFIWHTSFCCSTLLAKALEIAGRTVSLREPDVLINLANRFVRSEDSANRQRLKLVLDLLARPYAPGETVIVKPTNFANRLVAPTLAANPAGRAILLYSELPTLLLSLAKKGMAGRIWGRRLYAHLAAWTKLDFGFSAADTFQQTDLQIAGLTWLMQIDHFARIGREFGPARVMTIDSARFMADKEATLTAAAAWFGLDLTPARCAEIAAGPVFSRHSKFAQRDYSIEAREAEHAAAIAAYGEEIDKVVTWIDAVAAHCGVRTPI